MRRRDSQYSSERGFTLIELIVVTVIIGVLSATSMSTYHTYINQAYNAEADVNLHSLKTALEVGANDLDSSQFYFGWSASPGPVSSWTGQNLTPGFINGPRTLVSVWYSGPCASGAWGAGCGLEGATVMICKAGISRSWFKSSGGFEFTWGWQGAPWC